MGVTFDVRKSTGEVVGNSNGKFVTDASGSILISGVEPNTTLVITEVETISGYILDKTP